MTENVIRFYPSIEVLFAFGFVGLKIKCFAQGVVCQAELFDDKIKNTVCASEKTERRWFRREINLLTVVLYQSNVIYSPRV